MLSCNCSTQSGYLEIIQGTTPTLTLDLNMDFSQGYELKLAVKTRLDKVTTIDNNSIFVQKSDCGCIATVTFTQEQTLDMKRAISIQLSAKQNDTGMVYKTEEIEIAVKRSLDRGVM